MMTNKKTKFAASLLAAAVSLTCLSFTSNSHAEVDKITIDIQNGSNYMGMVVMKKMFWDEVSKKNGLTTELNLNKVGGPAAAADRFLSGANNGMTISYPLIMKLHEKTAGDTKILFANSMTNMLLNSNSETITSAKDFKAGDKIAVTALSGSIQAVSNKMLAEKTLGDHKKLDSISVQMSHPDAYAALMAGKVTAHWATPPFAYMELEDKKNHTVATSFDLFGKHHLTAMVVSEKFCKENEKVCASLYEANEKATNWINADLARAANFFKSNVGANEQADDYLEQLQKKQVEFNIAPQGVMSFANFLYKIGDIKTKLNSWKDICMPVLHGKKGS
jgi:NitT/TauT family transport system substrate-binding protein